MKVIIPSYNNINWIERCLESVLIQDHPDLRVMVIDDASNDGSAELISSFCERYGWDYRINDRNMRAGYNLFFGIHAMEPRPEEPVFILDGDDFLPHAKVLSRIEKEYENPDVWFCYARYLPFPKNTGQIDSRPYPKEWIDDADNGRLRYEENLMNHPLTFRYFLFCGLEESEMKDNNGEWFRAGYDRLIFVPMLEMARHHHKFVDEVLYCYNSVNPLSDTYANLEDAQKAHMAVFKGTPKKPMTRNDA